MTAVDLALETAIGENFDEVVVLGIKYDDTLVRVHTSMDYLPDVFMTLHVAAKMMLEGGMGKLND